MDLRSPGVEPRAAAAAAATRIRELTGVDRHDVALVLGSGWAGALDLIGETLAEVPQTRCLAFRGPGKGHVGVIRSVRIGDSDRRALFFGARTHLYEGRGVRQVVHGVRTAAAAGCRAIVLTNGCGGLREEWGPGTPVLISDHINLTATSPLEGATFVDLTDLYASRLRAIARQVDPSLPEGVYVQFPGPHYETPAEVQMAKRLGGDLVGMSTSLEAIAAREAGMEVLGISLVTNLAAGISPVPPVTPRSWRRVRGGSPHRPPARRGCGEDLSMRVAVTGAAGRIGRVVHRGLADRGHQVIAMDVAPADDVQHVDVRDTAALVPLLRAARASSTWLRTPTRPVSRRPGLSPAAHPQRAGGDARRWRATHRLREQQPRRWLHAPGADGGRRHRHRPDTFYGVGRPPVRRCAACTPTDTAGRRLSADRDVCRPAANPSGLVDLAIAGRRVRLVEASLTAPAVHFSVVYGISANARAWWDLGRPDGWDIDRRTTRRPSPRRSWRPRRPRMTESRAVMSVARLPCPRPRTMRRRPPDDRCTRRSARLAGR